MSLAVQSQINAALITANTRRLSAAAIRRELSDLPYEDSIGRAADLIEARDDRIEGSRLSTLLLAVRRVSVARLRRILVAAKVPFAEMPVRELTDLERVRLVQVLRASTIPGRVRPVPLEVNQRMRLHGAQVDAAADVLQSSVRPLHLPGGAARIIAEAVLVAARDAGPAPLVVVGVVEVETDDRATPTGSAPNGGQAK